MVLHDPGSREPTGRRAGQVEVLVDRTGPPPRPVEPDQVQTLEPGPGVLDLQRAVLTLAHVVAGDGEGGEKQNDRVGFHGPSCGSSGARTGRASIDSRVLRTFHGRAASVASGP